MLLHATATKICLAISRTLHAISRTFHELEKILLENRAASELGGLKKDFRDLGTFEDLLERLKDHSTDLNFLRIVCLSVSTWGDRVMPPPVNKNVKHS